MGSMQEQYSTATAANVEIFSPKGSKKVKRSQALKDLKNNLESLCNDLKRPGRPVIVSPSHSVYDANS